jgi:hypothetical protein
MIFDLQMFAGTGTSVFSGIGVRPTDRTVINVDSGVGGFWFNSSSWSKAAANATTGLSAVIGMKVDAGLGATGLSMAKASVSLTATDKWKPYFVAFGAASGWSALGATNDKPLITSISLVGDALTGNGADSYYTLNINNGLVSSMSLGKHQMNLRLSSVGNATLLGADGVLGGSDDVVVNNAIRVDNLAKSGTRTVEFAGSKEIKIISDDQDFGGTALIKNGKYNAALTVGTNLEDVTIAGTKGGSLELRTGDSGAVLNFSEGSDSVFVNMNDSDALGNNDGKTDNDDFVRISGDNAGLITINNLRTGDWSKGDKAAYKGYLNITGLDNATNVIINGKGSNQGHVIIADSNGKSGNQGIDTLSSVSIIGAEEKYAGLDGINATLSGKGIEFIDIANHGAAVTANNWSFTNRALTGAKGGNVVSIGDHGILDIEGGIYNRSDEKYEDGEWTLSGSNGGSASSAIVLGTHMSGSGDSDKTGETGDPSTLQITSAAYDNTAEDETAKYIGKYEGVQVQSQGKTYNALVTSGAAMSKDDSKLAFGSYDIIVGSALNLGDRTDKKVVYLNNDLEKNDWGETIAYSANMTSVISSTAGGTLVIGDFENKVYFRGEGDQDSLSAGYSYGHSGYDTLSSAAGKKAWMGTGKATGQTLVQLLHNGKQTYNFGFVGEDAVTTDSTGASKTITEDQKTGDVVALMNGMGYHSLQGSEHNRANLIVGSDGSNNITFQSINEGVHDIMYTYNLGKDNWLARVDTSLQGTTSGFTYSDDVNFYLGFGNGTKLEMNAGDTGKMVNYGGNNVIMDISTIDGSKAAGGNILNGEVNHAEYIVASEKVGDTLCGGVAHDSIYLDTASDTLVGGDGADVFQVGAGMGDDVINNITDGDTIIFLGSKLADAELNYEYDRMEAQADSHWMEVNFSAEAGGASIKLTPGDGVTNHLHEVKNVTAVFDDGTFVWDGSTWTKSSQA